MEKKWTGFAFLSGNATSVPTDGQLNRTHLDSETEMCLKQEVHLEGKAEVYKAMP